MNYKKYREVIHKDDFLVQSGRNWPCAVCCKNYHSAYHHHIKQQKVFLDDIRNMTILCQTCHSKYHAPSDTQFIREVKVHPRAKLKHMRIEEIYKYLGELKGGITLDEIRQEYKEKNDA